MFPAAVDTKTKVLQLSPCSGFPRLPDVFLSSQIREEIQTRDRGSQLTGRGGASAHAAPSESSSLPWLSRRYVSRADLQVALASLERRILQNISRQLEGNVGDGIKAALSREVRRRGRGSP